MLCGVLVVQSQEDWLSVRNASPFVFSEIDVAQLWNDRTFTGSNMVRLR